jgi:hypothetical protein
MDGVVLAVDGQDGDLVLTGSSGEDLPSSHHAFLVGQADRFAGQNGGMGGFQAGDADDGRNDEVSIRVVAQATAP